MTSELSRPEALEVANVLVTEWTGQAKNERGYVHDKWQPVDVTVRTEAVLRIADWLLGGGSRLVSPELGHRIDPSWHPGSTG